MKKARKAKADTDTIELDEYEVQCSICLSLVEESKGFPLNDVIMSSARLVLKKISRTKERLWRR
jgi:hypothetical protein